MSQDDPSQSAKVIRISKSDAESQHVEDLLRRQASLRGEGGITRDIGRTWYYQNWFVLGLAGFIAAIVCWAILRPFVQDEIYLQGAIEAIETPDPAQASVLAARMKLGGRLYPVIRDARERGADRKWQTMDLASLHEGRVVGIYLAIPREEKAAPDEMPLMYVNFIDASPPGNNNGTDDLLAAAQKRDIGFLLFFPLAAGLIGLGIGAADGLMCRLPRRVLLAGGIGLVVGVIGGFISSLVANAIYGLISDVAMQHQGTGIGGFTTFGFLLQVIARSLGWALAGSAMGVGQGLAIRSGRVILYGLIGGLIGGLLGGLLFDPIDFTFRGVNNPDAHLARLIALSVIGLSVGVMIGVVELLARDAWLRMVAGPLAGKEFLIFKNPMNVGASPKSDIYLFNDAGVAPQHAIIRTTGDTYEIEAVSQANPVNINGRAVRRSRLRHGDQIGLGRTVFVFQRKTG